MKGDFSRLTFDPTKHYSGVRMQQGRVQLDADWNEHLDITAHRIATEITDFIGQSGAPESAAGFGITVADTTVTIGKGRYYVDGMLFENEADVLYDQQPDFPGAALPTTDGLYLAYLDVWQRHVTALEDPAMREPALGGADTATRTQNVWQVKLYRLGDVGMPSTRQPYLPPWQPAWDPALSTGTLKARVSAPGAALENQLYRVEIHQAGAPGTATFTWSRDNGAVAARVAAIVGQTMTVSSAGRDTQSDFAANQWVELINAERSLQGKPGLLVELNAVQGDDLIVQAWPTGVNGDDLMQKPWPGDNAVPQQIIVRRWDSPGAIPVPATDTWVLLEDDIEVAFAPAATARYKTGDYWLIPARMLTGTIEWPRDATGPLPQLPGGIVHHYCSLALMVRQNGQWRVAEDWRLLFKPLGTGLVSKAGDTITGPLTVSGATTLQSTLSVAQAVTLAGPVGIGTSTPLAQLTTPNSDKPNFKPADHQLYVKGDVGIEGVMRITGRIFLGAGTTGLSDIAEHYASDTRLEPGDVVCLEPEADKIMRAAAPYDRLVLGVISTAPATVLGAADGKVFPVALCGRVPCKVVDENGPIRRGDLLTTSSVPGHAMKAAPGRRDGQTGICPGTVLGKALGALPAGKGVIEIFVMLR